MRFRELIDPALDASIDDAEYFDRWGGRVYVFQPEIPRPSCCRMPPSSPIELVLDPAGFEPLGVSHVISSAGVTNAGSLGLELTAQVHTVRDQRIFVYAVMDD